MRRCFASDKRLLPRISLLERPPPPPPRNPPFFPPSTNTKLRTVNPKKTLFRTREITDDTEQMHTHAPTQSRKRVYLFMRVSRARSRSRNSVTVQRAAQKSSGLSLSRRLPSRFASLLFRSLSLFPPTDRLVKQQCSPRFSLSFSFSLAWIISDFQRAPKERDPPSSSDKFFGRVDELGSNSTTG